MAKPTYEDLHKALVKIAHMRCDGDMWFIENNASKADPDVGEDIPNDDAHEQLVEAIISARCVLGIQETGPTQKPFDVNERA